MTESEQPRPGGENDSTDGPGQWVRVERDAKSPVTPSLPASVDRDAETGSVLSPAAVEHPVVSDPVGSTSSVEDLPEAGPELATEGFSEAETSYPEPEQRTRISPLARLRSTAHAAQALTTVERLRDGQLTLRRSRLSGWVSAGVITAFAFFLRLYAVVFANGSLSITPNLGYPNKLVFDETYYAKDAWTLWKFGYEHSWPSDIDAKVAAGDVDAYTNTAAFVAHPPVGKWIIGLGEQIFGMNSFGWRFMALVFGALLVFMTIRMARRLSRSTMIGALAGILLTFDGLSFVMSRIALLDGFQAFFLVAAVAAVLADRDWYRAHLADRLEALGVPDFGGRFGPIIWLRPWRLVAGVMFGLAIGTKWNSVFVLASMGLLSVIWDVGARRLAGADFRSWLALLIDGIPAFVRLVVVSALVYLASWWGWLTTSGGYDRDWGRTHPDDPTVKFLGEMWASLLKYHKDIYDFHNSYFMRVEATHAYDAHPSGWLLMVRPIGIDAVTNIKPGTDGCPADSADACIRVISGMGTPLLWWMAFAALLVAFIWWIGGRDWRFGVPIIAAMSTYLFWFPNADRPVFFFYAICIIPFTVTLLAMVLGLILGPENGPHRRRGAIIVGVAVALVILNFAYIYPLLTDGLLLNSDYYSRMWFRSWI